MRILVFFLLLSLPLRAAAAIDCSVIIALERVQFAQIQLAQRAIIDPSSRDALLIISQMGALDEDALQLSVQSTLSAMDQSRVMAFYNHSNTLRLTLLANRVDQAYGVLHAPAFEHHLANLKQILPRFNCNGLTTTQGSDGLDYNLTTGYPVTVPASPLPSLATTFVIIVLLGALFVAFKIKSSMTFRQARNKRHAKRYDVRIVTKIKNRGVEHTGTVLDISCSGVKIQITLFKAHRIGDAIEIWIEQKWKTAQITWANANFLGVQFDEALDHDYVMLLNASEQQSIRKNKNGARSGAAFGHK